MFDLHLALAELADDGLAAGAEERKDDIPAGPRRGPGGSTVGGPFLRH